MFPTVTSGNCTAGTNFFDFPTWYQYLDCNADGTPQIDNINAVWEIVAGIIDILLYVGGIAAVLFILYGGIRFVISQGQPDKIAQARQILIYAAVGLVITIIARTAVSFIFGKFT